MASTTTPGNASTTTPGNASATTTTTTSTIRDILDSTTLSKDDITKKIFDESDKDKSGKINIVEIHEIIRVKRFEVLLML
jgi:hypothetical protein